MIVLGMQASLYGNQVFYCKYYCTISLYICAVTACTIWTVFTAVVYTGVMTDQL